MSTARIFNLDFLPEGIDPDNTPQADFWGQWLAGKEDLEQSIIKLGVVKRYQGDYGDLIHEVILLAYDRWRSFDPERASFKTWVLWLTRMGLSNIYRQNRLPVPGARQQMYAGEQRCPGTGGSVPVDAEEVLSVIAPGPTPEEMVLDKLEAESAQATITSLLVLHRNTPKGQTLEAMAALIDAGIKLSLRNIAEVVGISHTTVATLLREIRGELGCQ